jgi:hypothetical protein
VTDRREQSEQLDLETALDEQEEGFDGWDIFDDEEEPTDFFSLESGQPAISDIPLPVLAVI